MPVVTWDGPTNVVSATISRNKQRFGKNVRLKAAPVRGGLNGAGASFAGRIERRLLVCLRCTKYERVICFFLVLFPFERSLGGEGEGEVEIPLSLGLWL